MKILTVLGTRPEIIRLSLIIPKLDRHADEHVLVHTGQNYTESLSGQFFRELGLRAPDYVLQESGDTGQTVVRHVLADGGYFKQGTP